MTIRPDLSRCRRYAVVELDVSRRGTPASLPHNPPIHAVLLYPGHPLAWAATSGQLLTTVYTATHVAAVLCPGGHEPADARRSGNPGVVGLTEREAQALDGMARGRGNRDIGRELFLSEATVKSHAHRLFQKLGAGDRAHAVAVGFRLGLLS